MKLRMVVLTVVTALAMTSLVVVSPAESAPRHWSGMAMSWHGRGWTKQLKHPILPRSTRLVPGTGITRTFLVRNQGPGPGMLVIRVITKDPHHLLVGRKFHLTIRARGTRWKHVVRSGPTRVIRVRILQGHIRKIWVRAALDRRAGNDTMHRAVPFRLKLRMTSARRRR